MRRLYVLLVLLAAFALAVVACGGDDEEAGGTGTEAGAECGSGSISLMGIWVSTEQQSIQGVIDAFEEKCPDVDVKYNPA
jgi:ABC-type glycerol-3-phosphate transport system substrate-binding protein